MGHTRRTPPSTRSLKRRFSELDFDFTDRDDDAAWARGYASDSVLEIARAPMLTISMLVEGRRRSRDLDTRLDTLVECMDVRDCRDWIERCVLTGRHTESRHSGDAQVTVEHFAGRAVLVTVQEQPAA